MVQIKETNSLRNPENSPSHKTVKAIKARADARRTKVEVLADWITLKIGSLGFLAINLILFSVWIMVNSEFIGGFNPFDGFPFGLLTLILSIEAIVLTIFVLISQNRQSRLFELREEMDLQIDLITEQELTKVLSMQEKIANKLNISTKNDRELKEMEQPTDAEKIEKALEKEV